MIDKQTVARIIDAAQIKEVVSDFVTLKKRGVNYIGLCPFHDEKTGSFTVSPAKGIFKCFGCGEGGNAVHFIMKHEQLDYPSALKYLAKKYNIEVQEKELTPEERQAQNRREELFNLNQFASQIFQDNLLKQNEGQTIGLSYFRERGFTDATIAKFQLGYALNRSGAFAEKALQKGFALSLLETTGLSHKSDRGGYYDRFRGRVLFPIHSISGKVVGFGGRILSQDKKAAKYLNSPESEIYSKSRELYGLYHAKNTIVKHDRCFLVEGYTDVISMHQAGVENVVSSSGTSLTPGQIKLIHRFTPNITVLYDGDAAGIRASLRGIDLLLEEGMKIKVVLLPEGEDPDSYAQSHNASDFIDFIDHNQIDFIRFKAELLMQDADKDPIKKGEVIKSIVTSISLINDEIMRQLYVKECSEIMDISENALINEINKLRRQHKSDRYKNKERAQKNGSDTVSSPSTPYSIYQKYNAPRQKSQTSPPPAPIEAPQPVIPENMPPLPPPLDYCEPMDSVPEMAPPMDMPPMQEPQYPIEENQQASQEAPQETAFDVLSTTPFMDEERDILSCALRYGQRIAYDDQLEDGTIFHMTCIRFFAQELQELAENGNIFYNPLHNLMLQEMAQHQDDFEFEPTRYFLAHENPAIQKLAADLISDRYIESKMFDKKEDVLQKSDNPNIQASLDKRKEIKERETLCDRMLYFVHAYKMAIVTKQIHDLNKQMKRANDQKDAQMVNDCFEQLAELQPISRQLAKELGDRVVF